MSREQTIYDMCLTYRHDFGLEISEDERMYTINAGMTRSEREALFNDMAQVYDQIFAYSLEEYRRVYEGEALIIPKSDEHAKAMMGVAQWYLDSIKCES